MFLQRIHPDDRARIEQGINDAPTEARDYAADYRIVLPDGSIKYIHDVVYAVAKPGGQIVERYGVIMDMTERKLAEEAAAARAANGMNDHRHHIAHLQVIHPDDVGRFASLGVTANMQALWAAHEPQMDELTIPFLGPERSQRQYVFRELADSGARLAAGSDWAVSSANPIRAIHVGVNRALYGAAGGQAEPFLPGQALELAEAMAAYTIGSAYVNHLDGVTGSISPGKFADLIVLDRDPFAGTAAEIATTSVLATYVQGEPVFRSERLG